MCCVFRCEDGRRAVDDFDAEHLAMLVVELSLEFRQVGVGNPSRCVVLGKMAKMVKVANMTRGRSLDILLVGRLNLSKVAK